MDFNWIRSAVHAIPMLSPLFRGIIFHNEARLHKEGFWIRYHDNDSEIGHFVLIYEKGDRIYVFDSLGKHPCEYGIEDFDWYNDRRLQPERSCSCGAFVLFVAECSINMRPPNVLHLFSQDYKENQRRVLQWLSKYTPMPVDLTTCQ